MSGLVNHTGAYTLADVVAHQQGKTVAVIRHFRKPGEMTVTSGAPAPAPQEKVAA